MNSNNNDNHIIEELQQMPKIKDDTDKYVLYGRIADLADTKTPNRKRRKTIPILATLFALIILSMIPIMMNTTFQSSESQSENSTFNAADKEIAINEKSDNGNEEENAQLAQEEAEQDQNLESTEQNSTLMDAQDEQLVAQTVDSQLKIVHAAFPDKQYQYVIPISFVIPQSDSINSYYNNFNELITEMGFTVTDFMLKDVFFQVKEDKHEVEVRLPADFSIGGGSTRAYIFEKLLGTMFVPYGIEKAVFTSVNDEDVDLGPIGTVRELPLNQHTNASYKLYDSEFLIPIPMDEQTSIGEAITEMKNAEESFNILQTIPSHASFSVETTSESELILNYTGDSLENNSEAVTMIEAILMTAKSYAFESVRFENIVDKQLGPYNLSEPINVPDAINPVDLTN